MRIDQICRDCELEISGILLMVDLRVMDISNIDVILGMDWLTTHRFVIDCDSRRITVVRLFRGTSMMLYPDRVRHQIARVIDGLDSNTYLGGRGET